MKPESGFFPFLVAWDIGEGYDGGEKTKGYG